MKRSFPSRPLSKAVHSRRSVNANQSNTISSLQSKLIFAHLRKEKTNRRDLGSARSRPNCVGSGWQAFNVRIKWRSRDAVSRMDRKSSRRKRHSADNTSHRFVRISWNTQANAHTAPDASSSTHLMIRESDSPIQLWCRITNATLRWDFSRRLRELTYFT